MNERTKIYFVAGVSDNDVLIQVFEFPSAFYLRDEDETDQEFIFNKEAKRWESIPSHASADLEKLKNRVKSELKKKELLLQALRAKLNQTIIEVV